MKRIVVTGGAGFIGANFVRHWTEKNPEDQIIVVDSLTYAGNRSSISNLRNVSLIVASIEDTKLVENLLRESEATSIVHFAAESHVDRSISGPDAFLATNILGTHSLLKAARSVWLSGSGNDHRFHHVSTDEVYGSLGPTDSPFSETTAYAPNSPYSATKAASDHLVRAYHHTYGLNVTTTNCSNNYGPYQFPEKLIPLFLLNALHGQPLPVYGDGLNVRDWLYVADHCRAIQLVLEGGRPGEVYNVGGGEELPNLEVIDTLCGLVDQLFQTNKDLADRFPLAPASKGIETSTLKVNVKDRAGHDRRYAIDERKIASELRYKPSVSFADGLLRTIQWYLDNELWWRSIKNGSYRPVS
jgi:dTDP-glucose 4,6-dehydratase